MAGELAGEIAGTEKLLRENPQITILRSEDALYCEFAFKRGVDFGGINFDLFLKASDQTVNVRGIS